MTEVQSPGFGWRKMRMVGYQGELSRSSIHRHSVSNRFSNQIGLPIAPARCATAVSTLMTRSRLATNAAVPAKSLSCDEKSCTTMPGGGDVACVLDGPTWRDTKSHPLTDASPASV